MLRAVNSGDKPHLRRWLRGLGRLLRTPPGAVLAACLVVLFAMFSWNTDWGGHPEAHRGDGKYRPVLARGDGHMMYLMTRSLVLDHDLVWDNDLARFGDPWNQPRTATGRKMIPHPIGPTLVQAPFFALAHGLSKIVNLFGAGIPSHGYTMFHQRIVFGANVVWAWLAALMGFLVARRWIGGRWAPLYGAVTVLFGTSIIYYATFMPSYAHAVDAGAGAAFVGYWALTFGQIRWKRFVVLGLLVGLAALIRITGFAWGLALVVELVVIFASPPEDLREHPRGKLALALAAGGALALAVALVVFIPQLVAWKLVFGRWVTRPMGPAFVRLDHPQIAATLFSSRNGWLSTHPIAYAGVVGLAFVPRRARVLSAALLPVIAVMVWVNSAAGDWWGGAAFGNRRLCSLTVVLVIGVAALVRAAGIAAKRVDLPRIAGHALAVLVFGWFLWWNLAQLGRLTHGHAPNSDRRTCCGYAPKPLRVIAQPIYDHIGNPFALPASAIFGLRHDVPWKRYDLAVGQWADRPDLREQNNGTYVKRTSVWNLAGAGIAPWLASGFGPSQARPVRFRWTTARRAHALVPLWMPDAREMLIKVVPNLAPGDAPMRVRVMWNGTVRYDQKLPPGEQEIRFVVSASDIRVGTNDIVFESEPGRYRTSLRAPPPRGANVGLAVQALRLKYLTK